jgi:hypothetical protein
MSYIIILIGSWCRIVVLYIRAPTDDETDDVNDNLYEEYHMKILFGNFNAQQLGIRVYMTLVMICVRIVNFASSKNLTVKSTMFPRRNIHKFTSRPPDGQTHNQIDYILTVRWLHSNVLDVLSFRAADCDTDYYLTVAKVREGLVVNKQRSHKFHMERFNLKKLMR